MTSIAPSVAAPWAKPASTNGARLSAPTVFRTSPARIQRSPSVTSPGAGPRTPFNCPSSVAARTIGPATSWGKNVTNTR